MKGKRKVFQNNATFTGVLIETKTSRNSLGIQESELNNTYQQREGGRAKTMQDQQQPVADQGAADVHMELSDNHTIHVVGMTETGMEFRAAELDNNMLMKQQVYPTIQVEPDHHHDAAASDMAANATSPSAAITSTSSAELLNPMTDSTKPKMVFGRPDFANLFRAFM